MKILLRWCCLFVLLLGCTGTKDLPKIDNKALELAREYSEELSGQALLVWVDGELILEDYRNDASAQKRYSVTEISTLFSGLMALAAKEDGLLQLDEPVAKTITAWKNEPIKSQITISQLLHLTGGINPGHYNSIPPFREILGAPLLDPPGNQFHYGPIPFQIFGVVMNQKVGFNYLKKRILNPLGIAGGYWKIDQEVSQNSLDSFTLPRLFDGANLTATELGRIGRLILNEGTWQDKTIIKDMKPLTQPAQAAPGYGLTVWLNRDIGAKSDSSFLKSLPDDIMLMRGLNKKRLIYDEAPSDLFMAAGRLNQRLYIIPSREMVVVRLGGADLRWSDARFLARLLGGNQL